MKNYRVTWLQEEPDDDINGIDPVDRIERMLCFTKEAAEQFALEEENTRKVFAWGLKAIKS